MKIITKEKKVTTSYTAYVAADGTEFLNEKACEEYEKTAYHAFSVRFKAIAVKLEGDKKNLFDCIIDGGCGGTEYYRVTPKDEAEVGIVMNFAVANGCFFPDKDTSWAIRACELKAGTTYIMALFESGDCTIYSRKRLTDGVMKALCAFDDDKEAEDDETH